MWKSKGVLSPFPGSSMPGIRPTGSPACSIEYPEDIRVECTPLLSGRNSVVECQLPKLKVAGSTPVARSIISGYPRHWRFTATMYAIVETGGKQYRVEPGSVIRVEALDAEVGSMITLDKVLLVNTEDKVLVGAPQVDSAKAVAEVMSHGRDRKVLVFKKKRRKNYHRTIGHRQPFTTLRIKELVS